MATGMDDLGKAISEGRAGFAESLDMLMSAHIRLFGTPNSVAGINRLETRITDRLLEVIEKADAAMSKRSLVQRTIDCVREKTGLGR